MKPGVSPCCFFSGSATNAVQGNLQCLEPVKPVPNLFPSLDPAKPAVRSNRGSGLEFFAIGSVNGVRASSGELIVDERERCFCIETFLEIGVREGFRMGGAP
ncbi:hypothetical protein COLO4_02779 [Corchorus olitorius]|uniref:Uncharacterized protein n=1 Tax=Corchorus olitorius TaxID=93759 RepID=A0A1R3L0B8_9ROSI|nr:hypothetical protein COLO4_02779 [Corchorus olitorius]